jgi:hypothetical protein
VDQHTCAKALAKVEQAWGKELGKLKQELHQTIYAHNHNADLMKQQKEQLEQIHEEIAAISAPLPPERLKMAKAQLARFDNYGKGQQKQQQKIVPLFQRLQALEQRLAMTAAASSSWPWPAAMAQHQMALQMAARAASGAASGAVAPDGAAAIAAAAAAADRAERAGAKAAEAPSADSQNLVSLIGKALTAASGNKAVESSAADGDTD